jgi:hypothetical protein
VQIVRPCDFEMIALASTFPWDARLRSRRSSFNISVFEDKVKHLHGAFQSKRMPSI